MQLALVSFFLEKLGLGLGLGITVDCMVGIKWKKNITRVKKTVAVHLLSLPTGLSGIFCVRETLTKVVL